MMTPMRPLVFLALFLCITASPAWSADAGAYGAFLAARFAAHQGQLGIAASKMQEALADDPGRPDLLEQAFYLSLLADRTDAARLAAELPRNVLAQLVLADTSAQNGDWQAAALGYALLPPSPLTELLRPVLLGWAEAGAGETAKALGTLEDAEDNMRDGKGFLLLHRALIADFARRNGLAAALYGQIEKAEPEPDLHTARILASFAARNGDSGHARALIEQAVSRNSEFALLKDGLLADTQNPFIGTPTTGIAEAYQTLAALSHGDKGSDGGGEVLAHMALRLNPQATGAMLMLTDMYRGRKQYAQAAKILENIAPTDPLAPLLRIRLASLKAELGALPEARAMLEEMAQTYPASPDPLIMLGDVLSDAKQYPDAVDAYSRAIARVKAPAGSDWSLFYARGAAWLRLHDAARSDADMREALQLAPDQPSVLNFLGFSWADRNIRLADARDMLERALKARPDDAAIIDSLAWVKFRQGDVAGAYQDLRQALSAMPGEPTITGHLGDVYWEMGHHLEAEHQWRRALGLQPDPDEQVRIEGRLKAAEAAEGP
jgi:tetratricopeptide (TPR) repeat protein